MVDLIINGLRFNWAGDGADHFYDGPAHGLSAPPEPPKMGPPAVAARYDPAPKWDADGNSVDIGKPADVCNAVRQLMDGIEFLHGPIMDCANDALMPFPDGSTLRADELKQIWLSSRFIVNNEQQGTSRGGKTLIEARQSHIRFTTVSGYHGHGSAQLHFIILHELMHMTEACSQAWRADWTHYLKRQGIEGPPPKKKKQRKAYDLAVGSKAAVYDYRHVEFRRTEQFTHLATRAVMTMIGVPQFEETYTSPPARHGETNMPPFGLAIEALPSD